jgi:hypothetical protein
VRSQTQHKCPCRRTGSGAGIARCEASPTASVWVCRTPSRVRYAGLRPPWTGCCKPIAGGRTVRPQRLSVDTDRMLMLGTILARLPWWRMTWLRRVLNRCRHAVNFLRSAFGPHTGRISAAFGPVLNRSCVAFAALQRHIGSDRHERQASRHINACGTGQSMEAPAQSQMQFLDDCRIGCALAFGWLRKRHAIDRACARPITMHPRASRKCRSNCRLGCG